MPSLVTKNGIRYVVVLSNNYQTVAKDKRFEAFVGHDNALRFTSFGETEGEALVECMNRVKEWLWLCINQ